MKQIITAIVANSKSVEIEGRGTGWVNLALLGAPLREAGVDLLKEGYKNLRQYFLEQEDSFEMYVDNSKKLPVYYVRVKQASVPVLDNKKFHTKRVGGIGNRDIRKSNYTPLEEWAYLRDINEFLNKLANMAQKELWSWHEGNPKYPIHPILFSYIRYTFCRLQHQHKIAYSIDGLMAAFNTGLTDDRYEPIIALFKKNRRPDALSEWVFFDFVISGEDRGKLLNSKFEGEILSATYTENPAELIYNINLGLPIIDYGHIILERVDRLPDEFIRFNRPRGFEVKDTENMLRAEKNAYFNALRGAIQNDSASYRCMINRLRDAINLAIKRVHWNYKNAVPMFYPKENRMCLLLPLCLVDDMHEDVALVVKLTAAKKYEGATILPLDWAYADARVVARPNSEWLDATKIASSGESLI